MTTTGDIAPLPPEPDGTDPEPPQPTTLEVVEEAGDWSATGPLEALAESVARALAATPEAARHLPRHASACIAFADDATVRTLNARYRGMDKPTNVLSFPASPPAAVPASPLAGTAADAIFLGDIVLAAETVAAEAVDRGIPIDHHVRHLIVHGVLHLAGLDHETEAEAAVMEEAERRVLAVLGIPDPYDEASSLDDESE